MCKIALFREYFRQAQANYTRRVSGSPPESARRPVAVQLVSTNPRRTTPRPARPKDALWQVRPALWKRRDRPALGRLVLRLVRRGLATAVQGFEWPRALRVVPCVEAYQNLSVVARSCASRVVWRTRVIENVDC